MTRLLIISGLIASIGIGTAVAQVRERDASWVAPTRASTRANPLSNRNDVVAGGEKIYLSRCASCHAPDGHGTLRAPRLSGRDVQAQSDGELFWKMSSGNAHAGMPAFSFLPERQRWQVVLHLRTLK
jgi:mono/diheme cytochrome c family protein